MSSVLAGFRRSLLPSGYYETAATYAKTLLQTIKDVILRSSLPITDCRGQCYDGAMNMSGHRAGVQALILNECHKALYVILQAIKKH
jgi:hypothetical protein